MSLKRAGLTGRLNNQPRFTGRRITLNRVSLRRFPFPSTASAVANYIEDVFSTYLYTGNGLYSPKTGVNTINNGINLSTNGGLVWAKSRSAGSSGSTGTGNNVFQDTVRGVSKLLYADSTGAENSYPGYGITSFNSNGFTLEGNIAGENRDGYLEVSWTFRKQAKFFDVVTYTGNGTAGRTVSHNLGSTPGCIIIKRTDSSLNWYVYHRYDPTKYLVLNQTAAAATFAVVTATSDTTFTLPNDGSTNGSGATYVAYLFAHDAGGFGATGSDNVISCGSFTSSTSSNVDVNLGYEPQLIIAKLSSTTGGWFIVDNMRGMPVNAVDAVLQPNTSGTEDNTNYNVFTPTATGFLATSAGSSSLWGNGQTVIYIAIRRGPMKTPTSGTSVFSPVARTGTGSAASITGVGFPPDLVMFGPRSIAENKYEIDRLRGAGEGLITNSTSGGIGLGSLLTLNMGGISMSDGNSAWNQNAATYVNWFFGRAPGFFDVVCYTGTGVSNTTVTHNLGASPELMLVKNRSISQGWRVVTPASIATNADFLLTVDAMTSGTGTVFNTLTSSSFKTTAYMNSSGENYVAYLFASCPGVSKVGSYTGTGTTLQVDCGFTAGARFVMIKRTDSTGDWYVWDSARGIIAGNDPHLLMNSSAAEVTNTDYIDPYSPGFEISSTAPAAINASGGTYIFLAIA